MTFFVPPVRAVAALAATAALSLGIAAPGAGAAATGGCPLTPGASCHHANLAGQDLSGRDLRRIDLTNASLKGTSFVGAHLEGALLRHADLRGAKFHRANLTGADLQKADLGAATIDGATAPRADFRHAKVRYVDFARTNLQHAQFGAADATAASFLHAHVQHASFAHADLHSASFEHATFQGTNFDGSGVAGIRLFPSRVGDDAVARRGLFLYVYLHFDAYGGFGGCRRTDDGQGPATYTAKSVSCTFTGDGSTTIPGLRGSGNSWGWHGHGVQGYYHGRDGTFLDGSFELGHFNYFNVKKMANLGHGSMTYLPTGDGAKGHPGGPFNVVLNSVGDGFYKTGYVNRLSGYLQRAH